MSALHKRESGVQRLFATLMHLISWPWRQFWAYWDPPADLSTIPGLHVAKKLQLTPVTETELVPNKPAVLVYVYSSRDSRARQNHRRAMLRGIAYTDSELKDILAGFEDMPWILHNLVAMEDEQGRVLHRSVEPKRDLYSTFASLGNARMHLLGGTPAATK